MEKRKKRTRYARFGVFVLLLSMLVPLPAFAAGSANVVRTFVYENNLYTYVELNEIERPVTQVEEVAVNNPVKKPALCPSREAMGRVSSRAPTRMMMAKEAATIRVALRLRPRTNPFRSQRAHRFSTVRSSYVKVKTN